MKSAIYFRGSNMSKKRIQNITKTGDGKTDYKKVIQRQKWVKYLENHEVEHVNESRVSCTMKWVKEHLQNSFNKNELSTWVGNYICSGN